jgi:ribonuclease HII
VVVERSGVPSLRVERRLLREGHRLVAGMDEVGRGALAGPVTVGVVVVDAGTRTAPAGVRDSKLLTPAARQALVPALRRWGVARAVGHAEPAEIDALGIIAALRLAGRRALSALPVVPECVILDGSHNWLTGRPRSLALEDAEEPPRQEECLFEWEATPPGAARSTDPAVRTMVKADRSCAAVAAASVLAKVERDAIMVERSSAYPGYGWALNKGYSAPEHIAALRAAGTCPQHRRSWSLPGVDSGSVPLPFDGLFAADPFDQQGFFDQQDPFDQQGRCLAPGV